MSTSHEMTRDELRDILLDCAGAEEGVDLSGDIDDLDFDDLGYDSLALLEMTARIEQSRGVKISDDALAGLRTPRAVLDLVNGVAATSEAGSAPASAAISAAAER